MTAGRRVPLLPTLLTAVMLAVLIALGVWQLQRREWKTALIASLEAARTLPLLEPSDFDKALHGGPSVQYRRAELSCRPGTVRPYDLKGGSSIEGKSGYLVLVACTPGKVPPAIVAVAGWTQRPDAGRAPVTVDTVFQGLIIERPYGDAPARPQFMLIADTAVPPLQRSRMPTPDDLPDNHLSYAGQWFGLAGVLVVIYAIWLCRRLRGETVAVGDHSL